MLMTTVVAIALGVAPAKLDGTTETVSGDFSREVGRFSETVDLAGVRHLRGFDRVTGAAFDLAVDRQGHVKGTAGNWSVDFSVQDAS